MALRVYMNRIKGLHMSWLLKVIISFGIGLFGAASYLIHFLNFVTVDYRKTLLVYLYLSFLFGGIIYLLLFRVFKPALNSLNKTPWPMGK